MMEFKGGHTSAKMLDKALFFFSLFSEASFQDLFHFFNATASFLMLLLPSGYNGNTTVISPLQKATLFRKEHGKQALKGNTC